VVAAPTVNPPAPLRPTAVSVHRRRHCNTLSHPMQHSFSATPRRGGATQPSQPALELLFSLDKSFYEAPRGFAPVGAM